MWASSGHCCKLPPSSSSSSPLFLFGSAGSLIPFSQQWEKNRPHSTVLLSHKAESEAILHHRKGGRPYLEQIHIHSSHECVTIKAALDLCQVDSITRRRIHGFPVDLAFPMTNTKLISEDRGVAASNARAASKRLLSKLLFFALLLLLSTTLNRPRSGRNFSGMNSDVRRPITTAFFLDGELSWRSHS
jgi:hypothetical protein